VNDAQRLVLDRFVNDGAGGAVDLATGAPVWVHLAPAGDHGVQLQRLRTAASLAAIRHPVLAPLIDFGLECRGTWVEVYGVGTCGPDAAAAGVASSRTRREIDAVLDAAGLCGVARVGQLDVPPAARGMIWPGPVTRLVEREPGARDDLYGALAAPAQLRVVAQRLQRRPELDQLTDLLDDDRARGPRRVTVVAPPGSGLRTLFAAFAREARLRGFVPVGRETLSRFVSQSCIGAPGLTEAMRHRHVVVLDDQRGVAGDTAASPASALLMRIGPAQGRPHLVISAVACATAEPGLVLRPMEPDALTRAVISRGVASAELDAAVRRAIRLSGGWPGAFFSTLLAALVGPDTPYPAGEGRGTVHVAESIGGAIVPSRPSAAVMIREPQEPGAFSWPDGADVRRAWELVARGRHAAAERVLRRALGALRRRNRPGDAGRTAMALGRLLHARGRMAAAVAAFEQGRALFARADSAMGEVAALLHLGHVRVDDGDLAGADSTLRTALVVAEQAGWDDVANAARLLLARCVFWQGRLVEAAALVERAEVPGARVAGASLVVAEHSASVVPASAGRCALPGVPACVPGGTWAIRTELGVRLALADRDGARATRWLTSGTTEPHAPDALADLMRRALGVLVASALGETARAERELAAALAQARRGHLPLMAMEARAAFAEGCLEAGNEAAAGRTIGRLARLGTRLPRLLRLHLDQWRSRLDHRADGHASTEGAERVDTAIVLEVLRHCQEADDDQAVLDGVCRSLRGRLEASAVTVHLGGAEGFRVAATAGARGCRPEMVERCAATRFVLGPEPTAAGVEAAVAVTHGGQVLGGLAVRWPADARPDGVRVRGVLSAAAAAIAPAARALEEQARAAGRGDAPSDDLAGVSAVMADLRRQIRRAAEAPFAVLVQGESGTGKELIARAIHGGSPRRARRLCALNCAALSDDLFETELFGHVRGAFTGAASDRAGMFEEADGGTLFLDEVGELTPRAQAKLLRAIQEGEIRRIGENHARRTDARIVAATNRLLESEVERGRFRQDLLFRLDVLRIVVPPLRDHPDDIPELAHRFWKEALLRIGGRATLAPATVAALARYHWPGNVRELQNVMAALAVYAPQGGRVGPSRLPAAIAGVALPAPDGASLATARRQFEERFVRATLARSGGGRSKAAATLGLTRQGLVKLMARLGIADAAVEPSVAKSGAQYTA